jgi:rapamycin-insensitive companion of mTOR
VTRYLLKTTHDLQIFNNLQLPYLICRSLDILLKNEEERIQALKLIRKMIFIAPDLVSPALVRVLVSLGDTSMVESTKPDRIHRACLATLSELGVLNPTLLIVCNGVAIITRNVLECDSPRIAESLVGVLLHLLEYPQTRSIAGVRLDCLAAPYCDFTYRLGIMDKNKDARDLRFKCSRLALLSVLRSWAGTLEFCNPNNNASGLKAIIDILYLNQLEVRKAILDLMYELLGLPQPAWTDEYSVALAAVDPSDYQDSWRLTEGFVAMEGRSILPSLASKVPNICEIHQAFLVYCFIENGLLNALTEVIVSSDTFISVRATILLAKLLQLIHTMLPADICSSSSALPTLISKAVDGNHQAKAAVSALQTYHQMLRSRPSACSLYLDVIIQNGDLIKTRLFKREIDAQQSLSKSASLSLFERIRTDSIGSNDASGTFWDYWDVLRDTTSLGGEADTSKDRHKRSTLLRQKVLGFFEKFRENERLIKDSLVLTHVDSKIWDWDIIYNIFRNKSLSTKFDENQLKFIKTLANYFKPSSNKFSHQELGLGRLLPPNVNVGIELIDYLLEHCDELEYMRILTDFCSDISIHLQAIYKKKPHVRNNFINPFLDD